MEKTTTAAIEESPLVVKESEEMSSVDKVREQKSLDIVENEEKPSEIAKNEEKPPEIAESKEMHSEITESEEISSEIAESEEQASVIKENFVVLFRTELKKLQQASDSEYSSGEEFPGLMRGKPQPKLLKFVSYTYVGDPHMFQAIEEPEIKKDELPDDVLNKFETVIEGLVEKPEYQEFVRVLEQAFPQIDREHVIYMLKLKELDNGECWITFKRMGLRGIFPKALTIEEIRELERKKKIILDAAFTLRNLVDLFEGDPLYLITDVTLEMNERYIRCARAQLARDFPKLTRRSINIELKDNYYHYYPAYKALQRQMIKETSEDDLRAVHENRPIIELEELENPWEFKERLDDIPYKFPLIPDIDFYMEHSFVKQRNQYIKDILGIRLLEKQQQEEEGSESAPPVYKDCDLCSESGVLIKTCIKCLTNGHAICDYCIRVKALQILKDVETPLIKCGVDNCNSVFFFKSITRVLPKEICADWLAYLTTKQVKYNKDFPGDTKCLACYMYMLASLWSSKCTEKNCIATKYQRGGVATTTHDYSDEEPRFLFKINF